MQNWNPSSKADQNHLARFIVQQSSDPNLKALRSEALRRFLPITGTTDFCGYEQRTRENVWSQIKSLYDVLLTFEPHLHYSLEPQNSFTSAIAQKVRSVDELLSIGEANCIDIVVLMSALLIHIGLNPVVLVVGDTHRNIPTHALLGFWLHGRTFSSVKVPPEVVLKNMNSIGICELTGLLQQPPFPFITACNVASRFFPLEFRKNIPHPEGPSNQLDSSVSIPEYISILYGIDVKKAMLDYANLIPVIAIMGAKGGVGKTIIAARISELIAETNMNVLLIDFDIENAGSTVFHRERVSYGQPSVKTVYDHIVPYTKGIAYVTEDENLNLWDITPHYLNDNDLGRVLLIPARPDYITNAFEIIANIDYSERNQVLAKATNDIIDRAGMVQDIRCVIIDCGAGNNPIYSAALNRSKYGIIIATPEDVCVQQLSIIRGELKARFPQTNLQKVKLIVNRVRDPLDIIKWKPHRPAGYIRESNDLTDDYYRNAVYFDLGYDDFSLDIRESLSMILEKEEQSFLPSEYAVWLRKWIDLIQKDQIAQKLLNSKPRKRKFFLSKMFPIAVGILLIGSILFFSWSMSTDSLKELTFQASENLTKLPKDMKEESLGLTFIRLLGLIAIVVNTILLGISLFIYKRWTTRKRLLIELSKIGTLEEEKIQEYIENLIHPEETKILNTLNVPVVAKANKLMNWLKPSKESLKWLREIMDKEIEFARKSKKKTRMEVKVNRHL